MASHADPYERNNRARENGKDQGDKFSKLFFAYVKQRKQKQHITMLKEGPKTISKRSDINKYMIRYFTGILGVKAKTS